MNAANKALIATRTNELAAQLKIADQLEGMTTARKLEEIARRFSLVKKADAAAKCLEMAACA